MDVKSNTVKDKVPAIFVCQHVGEPTKKYGRSGMKYLATNKYNPDLIDLLQSGVRYKVTGKVDGTCSLIMNGKLNARRDIKPGKKIPPTWFQTGIPPDNDKPQHFIGFLPITAKEYKWHLDCFTKDDKEEYNMNKIKVLTLNTEGTGLTYDTVDIGTLEGKSVEVMGPKFQSNPHKLKDHVVMIHGLIELPTFPGLDPDTDILDSIKEWFKTDKRGRILEGVVVHFETGEMFKIHRHHLDMEWKPEKIDISLEQIDLS